MKALYKYLSRITGNGKKPPFLTQIDAGHIHSHTGRTLSQTQQKTRKDDNTWGGFTSARTILINYASGTVPVAAINSAGVA